MLIRLIVLFIAASMIMSSSGCEFRINSLKVLDIYEKTVSFLGRQALTPDLFLIGEREYFDCSRYTGKYFANCIQKSGTDIIFGGTSTKNKKIRLHGTVQTECGNVTIALRSGTEYRIITADADGKFEESLTLYGGDNYLEATFENFSGKIEIVSEKL